MPDVDLSDPGLDPVVQQEFRNREQNRTRAAREVAQEPQTEPAQDAKIRSMIETIGQLEIGEDDQWDFYGISSGAVFLRRMKENFQGLLGHDYRDYRLPFLNRPPRPPGIFSLDSPRYDTTKHDSPRSTADSPSEAPNLPSIYDLPPREKVDHLVFYALDCATCLMRIVHRPSFDEMLDRVYDTPSHSWGPAETRFLGLLYAAIALGCMYDNSDDGADDAPSSYKTATEEA